MSKELNEQTKIMGISSPSLINQNHDFSEFDCGEPALKKKKKKETEKKEKKYRRTNKKKI